MSRRSYKWFAFAALAAAAAGSAVGVVRWLGPDTLVRAVEPLGRAPVFIGVVAPHVAYFLVQLLPGGRDTLWLGRYVGDAWVLVLGQTAFCATVAAFPMRRGDLLDAIFSAPFALISTFFFIDRMRRVQRELAGQPPVPSA